MKTITPMVVAALVRNDLTPEDLKAWWIGGGGTLLFLELKTALVLEVEIASLPAVAVKASPRPEVA